ncbi:ALP1-like protein [Tanacetum coccineum]
MASIVGSKSKFFYDHVSFHLKCEIDRAADGKLRNKNADESWEIIEDLALYDHEGWDDTKEFIKPVKAITAPQGITKIPDRRLLELEDQINFLLKGSRPASIPQPQALGTNFEARVRDYMVAHTERMEQDLWIWHAFFGVAGSNNDVNVLRQFPVLNDLKVGKAPEVPFVANDVTYKWGYYLTDGIYPEWAVLMKSISQPGSNDVKRIRYKQAHEAARKDVKRAFGVLNKKWAIVRTPARSRSLKRITHLMYTCIILHNIIRKEKGKTISPDFYPEE